MTSLDDVQTNVRAHIPYTEQPQDSSEPFTVILSGDARAHHHRDTQTFRADLNNAGIGIRE